MFRVYPDALILCLHAAPLLLQHIVHSEEAGRTEDGGLVRGTDERGHCQGAACALCALNQFYSGDSTLISLFFIRRGASLDITAELTPPDNLQISERAQHAKHQGH